MIGAVAGTSYTVTVVARGPGGTSPVSPASAAVVPAAPAAPVTVPAGVPLTLTTDKGQLSLAVPAQQITVIGTGFAPYSTARVTIYSDPVVLATVTTDGDGSFAAPVTVPADLAVGSHTLLAQGVDPQGATRQMALPVTVPPTAPDSSGAGDETQTTTLPVPSGGSLTLLDAAGNPVTTVTVAGQGTYALDATTGTITFVPVAGFVGRATPVRYRLTDAVGSIVDGTYTAVVSEFSNENPDGPQPSTGSVKVIVPKLVVTRGAPSRATMTATATFTSAIKGRSTFLIWSTVSGKRVTLGRGTVVMTAASRRTAAIVTLNALGRSLSARPGGYPVAVAVTTVPSSGRTLRASSRTSLVLSSFTAPQPVYFGTGSARVSRAQQRYLTAMRARLGGVATLTCTGHTDDRGSKAAGVALGRKRARQVCSTLKAGRTVRVVIVTRGESNPLASNKTKAGMARNRRVDIKLTY
ncbi:OmpA family protein [Actinoplanes sp. N902-109]|uniref:OmpA family protein n=1 Tax=Actinoplanes sp. (strain N902-109) TaxID=649831 RepID=UPI0003294269|nr:OmpA family protein [Actinoplanes sp. N902-109]AGL19613.1 OmpA/MotB domain protein [Actinoplanes sp. N902-109]